MEFVEFDNPVLTDWFELAHSIIPSVEEKSAEEVTEESPESTEESKVEENDKVASINSANN